MAGGAGGQAGVRVGRVGAGGVGEVGGPGVGAVGGDLDLVAGDDAAAVVGRGGPGEVDLGTPARRGREAGRGAGGDRGQGGVVDDGGDAVQVGGEGLDIVAGGVLDGVGIVAAGGVGVGENDGLALADIRRRKRESNPVTRTWDLAGGAVRNGIAACSDREGGDRGPVGPVQVLGNWNSIIEPLGTTVALISVGGVVSAETAAVAALVSVSALLSSSV